MYVCGKKFTCDFIRSGSGERSIVPQHAIMFLSYKIINIKLASFLNGKITMSIYYMHFATHHPITKFVSNTLSCWSCSSTCALASPVISPFPFLRLLLASHTTHIYTSVTGQWLWMLSSTKYFLVHGSEDCHDWLRMKLSGIIYMTYSRYGITQEV